MSIYHAHHGSGFRSKLPHDECVSVQAERHMLPEPSEDVAELVRDVEAKCEASKRGESEHVMRTVAIEEDEL